MPASYFALVFYKTFLKIIFFYEQTIEIFKQIIAFWLVCIAFTTRYSRSQQSSEIMQDKAYAKGSPWPACEPGKLRIYSMRFCPYAERALLVAAAKNIPHEIVNVNLGNKPEWIFEKNSEGKVPVLEMNGKLVAESLIISDFLDESFTENRLLPQDPYQKAVDKMLIEKFGKVIGFFNTNYPVLVTGNKDKWEEVFTQLQPWEEELKKRGTTFFSGNKPGMLDYMIWPWLQRIEVLTLAFELEPVPKEKFPILTTWIANMFKDPAVKQTAKPVPLLKGYYESRVRGQPDFDFGL